MADWLKVNHSLVRSAKVRGLMRELRCKKHAALGLAVNWLCWIDEQTTDGQTGLLPDELDDEIGFRGCTDALISIGWAALGEDGCVCALEFGKHCGESAKERAENARRVAKCKAKKRKVMADCYQGNEKTLPDALPEKNRIDRDKEEGAGIATLYSGREQMPAPTPDGFGEWLAALCAAHPSASKSRTLAPDVREAALDAFGRFPDAVEQVELLTAYFKDSRLAENNFYAPRGQRKFFEDLEDVVAHAERWKKWAGWKPKKASASAKAMAGQAERNGVVHTPGCEVKRCAGVMSEAEREEFFAELRK
ncbi:MAG: hypothetical protein IJN29_01750 [Akkermansia sp.]|nr:hypothetical protein [Akkermansia sp.]